MPDPTLAGLTVADVARRYRVSKDKVRAWIVRGELAAINTAAALCSKPRFVVTPEALAVFEGGRTVGPPTRRRMRKKRTKTVDFYPD
jgi:hypothetical protein